MHQGKSARERTLDDKVKIYGIYLGGFSLEWAIIIKKENTST